MSAQFNMSELQGYQEEAATVHFSMSDLYHYQALGMAIETPVASHCSTSRKGTASKTTPRQGSPRIYFSARESLPDPEASEEGTAGTQHGVQKADFMHAIWLIWQGPLLPLFIVFGMEIMGAAMTLPVFAFFVISDLKLSATQVGVLGAAFNLTQAVGSPIFGRVSDAVGRKGVLLCGFVWSSACFYLTYFVQGFYELFALRLLAGMPGGNVPIASAMIMDAAKPAERPQILGIKGAIFGFCFTVGPLLAVLLRATGLLAERRDMFLAAACLCFLGVLVGCFVLQETLPAENRRELCGETKTGEENGGTTKDDVGEWSWITPGMVCAFVARFFYAFGAFSMFYTYGFVIKENFGWSDKELGIIMMLSGVAEGLLGVFLYPRVDKHFGEHLVCVFGFVCMGSALPLIPSMSVPLHLLGFFGFQLGQCFAEPGVVNLIGYLCPSERHMGFAMGASNGLRACASVVAPICAGMLFDIKPVYTFVCASAMIFTAAVFVLVANRFAGEEPEQEALLKKGTNGTD